MTSSPFDELAADYDRDFTHTTVGRELRSIVRDRMSATFHAGHHVLEIGCGTGEDALWLARRGITVSAIDASGAMVDLARAKIDREGYAGLAEVHCISVEDLPGRFHDRTFDAVFSNFGAINCARDIATSVQDVAGLVRPGGKLLWVVMGRHVPWEWTWYGVRGDWRKASRRYQAGGSTWRGLRITYPTPRELARVLEPWYQVTRVLPLGWALPPSYAAGWCDRAPRLFAAVARMERRPARSTRLAALLAVASDHFIIEATRRSA